MTGSLRLSSLPMSRSTSRWMRSRAPQQRAMRCSTRASSTMPSGFCARCRSSPPSSAPWRGRRSRAVKATGISCWAVDDRYGYGVVASRVRREPPCLPGPFSLTALVLFSKVFLAASSPLPAPSGLPLGRIERRSEASISGVCHSPLSVLELNEGVF